MGKPVPVRFTDADYARFAECAKREGVSIAVWIRFACSAYAETPAVTTVNTVAVDVPMHPKAKKSPDAVVKLAPIAEIDPTKPKGVKVEHEDIGGFKIPKDIVKSRAERLGLDNKPKGAAELFGHMLSQEE